MTDELRQKLLDVRTEVGKAVVGQDGALWHTAQTR